MVCRITTTLDHKKLYKTNSSVLTHTKVYSKNKQMKGQTNEDFHVFYFRKMAKGSTVELHL